MTKTQAAALKEKWEQCEGASKCAHPRLSLAGIDPNQTTTRIYYCTECGERIVRYHPHPLPG